MGENPEDNVLKYDVTKVSEELRIRPEVLSRLVASFAKTLSEKMVTLEEAVLKEDILKMRALLHEIRGTSANLRLEAIATTGRIMHEAVKSETDRHKVPEYFKALKAQSEILDKYEAKQERYDVENPNR